MTLFSHIFTLFFNNFHPFFLFFQNPFFLFFKFLFGWTPWTDLIIEQTLMKNVKSEGGLTHGRWRNGESAHLVWVQTLGHLSQLNHHLESSQNQSKPLHRDLAAAQMRYDSLAVKVLLEWFNEMFFFFVTYLFLRVIGLLHVTFCRSDVLFQGLF